MELQMKCQTSDVSTCNGNKKCPTVLEHQVFTQIFAFKLFHVSIAVTNGIRSNLLFVIRYYFYHKLAKFEQQNRMIRTTQNLDLFEKKGYYVNHF